MRKAAVAKGEDAARCEGHHQSAQGIDVAAEPCSQDFRGRRVGLDRVGDAELHGSMQTARHAVSETQLDQGAR